MQRVENMIEKDRQKWGGMTPGTMGRLGLAELREAVSFGGNVAQPTPYGMYGTLTPGEVGAARDKDGQTVRQMEEEALPARLTARTPTAMVPAGVAAFKVPSMACMAVTTALRVRKRRRFSVMSERPLSPGDIAAGNSHGSAHGDKQQENKQNLPSAGEIAEGQSQQRGQQHSHGLDHGQSRGRGK